MVFVNQSHGIRLAVIGYLAAIALGYALGRARGHVVVQCGEIGPDMKKATKTKMVKGRVTTKRDKDECHGEKTTMKNPEQQKGYTSSSSGKSAAIRRFELNAKKCSGKNETWLGKKAAVFLIPRETFLNFGRFKRNDHCLGELVSLAAVVSEWPCRNFELLYICHRWHTKHMPESAENSHYNAVAKFVNEHPRIDYIFIDYCCINQQVVERGHGHHLRWAQLSSLPLAILSSDYMLVLPKLKGKRERRATDLHALANRAWFQLEYLLADIARVQVYVNFACGEWEECLGIVKGNMPLTDTAVKAEKALNAFHSSKTTGILPISKECSSMSPWMKKTGGEEPTVANDTHHFNEPPMLLKLVANDVETLRSDKGVRTLELLLNDKVDSTDCVDGVNSMMADLLTSAALGDTSVLGDRPLVQRLLLLSTLAMKCESTKMYSDAIDSLEPITYHPIGVIESPYMQRFGCPRQPRVSNGSQGEKDQEGKIKLMVGKDSGKKLREALENLNEFSHCWCLTHMHLNGTGWKSRLPTSQKKGTFATRSPHRPNPVALSCFQIVNVDVKSGIILVNGVDLLNGTPVIDIKPYIPYADCILGTRSGWLDDCLQEGDSKDQHAEQEDMQREFSLGGALLHHS